MRLLCVHYGRDLPSARIRVAEMLPHLEGQGVTAGVVAYPRSAGAWIRLVAQVRQWDVLWLQKRLPSLGAGLLLRAAGLPVVYDFDDAVCFRRAPRRGDYRSRRRARRFSRVATLAAAVTCGNRSLAALLPRGVDRVLIYPSPVRTDVAQRRYEEGEGPFRLVWIGVGANLDQLRRIGPALAGVAGRIPLRLRVISDRAFSHAGLDVDFVPWSLGTQEEALAGADLGLMPLDPESPFDRCKCSYKLLQYMASGVAVAGSAVGMNRDLIRDGVNGRLVPEEGEWGRVVEEALRLGRSGLARLAAEGRRTVLEGYGYPQHAARLAAFFREVVRAAGVPGRRER